MKEKGPVAGINCENTMTKISHAEGTYHQDITKIIMKESIIIHFKTIELVENIKNSYKDKHREENHKYKRRSKDYHEDVYDDRYNRDEYEYHYRDGSYHMPPHFQVQSTFVNH